MDFHHPPAAAAKAPSRFLHPPRRLCDNPPMGFLLLPILLAQAALLLWLLALGTILHRALRPTRRGLGEALARGYPVEPADLKLEGRERDFDLPGGARTTGFVVTGRRADGPAAVVLHGHASSRYSALARVEVLADFCSTLVCFDLRGHGSARGPGAEGADFGLHATADIRAVLEQAGLADRPLVLLGGSMGSAYCLRSAVEGLPQVRAVVLESPYRTLKSGKASHIEMHGLQAGLFLPVSWQLLCLFRPHIRREDLAVSARDLRVPLLVLHARADPVCPLAEAEAIAAAAPQGKLVTFAHDGHLGLLRADPAGYRAAIADFLLPLHHA